MKTIRYVIDDLTIRLNSKIEKINIPSAKVEAPRVVVVVTPVVKDKIGIK